MKNAQPVDPKAAPRIIMIICGALIWGALLFLAIILFMSLAELDPDWKKAGPLSLGALGLALTGIGAALFVPPILSRAIVTRAARDRRSGSLSADPEADSRIVTSAAINHNIIRYALLEGPVFFSGLALFLEKCWLPLGAAGLLIAMMIVLFPWPGRFDGLRDHLREELR